MEAKKDYYLTDWIVSTNRIYYQYRRRAKVRANEPEENLDGSIQSPPKTCSIRYIDQESDVEYVPVTRVRDCARQDDPPQTRPGPLVDHVLAATSEPPEPLVLGAGYHGKVDVVTTVHGDQINTRQFARKEYISDNTENDDDPSGSGKPKAQRNLEDEVRILNQLDIDQPTDHRVKIHDAYILNSQRWFLIMDPVANGGTLEHKLISFAFARATKTAEDVAMLQRSMGCLLIALASLHDQGFRHRDLHPGNILFHNGELLLCDFGASLHTHIDDGQRSTTTTYFPPRMERYAAPEVISTQGERNKMTDVFSLGAILLEMLLAVHDHETLARLLTDGGWRYESRMDEVRAMTADSSRLYRYTLATTLVGDMMNHKKEKRPKAEQVAAEIVYQSQRNAQGWYPTMCSKCHAWICGTGLPEEIERAEEEFRRRVSAKSWTVRSKSR